MTYAKLKLQFVEKYRVDDQEYTLIDVHLNQLDNTLKLEYAVLEDEGEEDDEQPGG